MTIKEEMLPIIPIGVSEIADILEINRERVAQWKFHNKLPKPDYELKQGPLWDLPSFLKWLDENGIKDKRRKENQSG